MRPFPILAATLVLAAAPALRAEPPVLIEVGPSDWEEPTMSVTQALEADPPSFAAKSPLNITNEGPTKSSFILGAANTAGKFNSYFTTDLFIVNPHPLGTAKVNLYALRANTDNVSNAPPAKGLTIPAFGWVVVKDVLSQLGVTGGAAVLVSVDAAQSTGTSTTVHSFAYTSTPGPAGGRYGVNIHGVGVWFSDTLYDGWAVGAAVNAQSRTNVGVLNYSTDAPLTTYVDVTSPSAGKVKTLTLNVPRLSFTQVSLGDSVSALEDGLLRFHDGTTKYVGYMVVNDNLTNDANFQLAASW